MTFSKKYLKYRDMSYIRLFFVFLKIGLFGLGGGHAMIALAEIEFVERRRYLTPGEFSDFYATSQTFPGIVAVNFTSFVGHRLKGFWGAVIAILGVITPAVICILLIAGLIQDATGNPFLKHALSGIRIAVAVLVLSVAIRLARTTIKNRMGIIIAGITFICLTVGLSPIIPLVGSGVLGWLYYKKKNKVFE